MQHRDFVDETEKLLMRCKRVLEKKAELYAPEDDRLSQFKTMAVLEDTTPIQALGGAMAKHTATLYHLINYSGSEKQWAETLVDHINYLILLNALLKEKEE
uniref:Uncharacterized protein n=1 Tax=viral metagenome TaxID=1070528 RepID=A0A6M3JC71_9ZZZZ